MNDSAFRPPGPQTELERRLRAALGDSAARVAPTDRRSSILSAARDDESLSDLPGAGGRRWFALAAAAAVLMLVSGLVWLGGRPGRVATVAASTGTPTQTVTASVPSPAPTSPPATRVPTSPATAAVHQSAMPVYFVGLPAGPSGSPMLYREFLRVRSAGPLAADDLATRAVAAALRPGTSAPGVTYLDLWAGTGVVSVELVSISGGHEIHVTLTGTGQSGLSGDQAKAAVGSVVWTATAAYSLGSIPVRITVADGSTTLFGRYPLTGTTSRPPTDTWPSVLAPLWISAPSRGDVLGRGTRVVVTGESSTFERGSLHWTLSRDGSVVRTGTTPSGAAGPLRGPFRLDLGVLDPGSYELACFEPSAKDGSAYGTVTTVFSVR